MPAKKYEAIIPEVFRLVKKESPVTTTWIANQLNVNWATAQRALSEVERDGKIKGSNVSASEELGWPV